MGQKVSPTGLRIGINKDWKRDCPLPKRVNQNFVNIPHQRFIEMVQYKCENVVESKK